MCPGLCGSLQVRCTTWTQNVPGTLWNSCRYGVLHEQNVHRTLWISTGKVYFVNTECARDFVKLQVRCTIWTQNVARTLWNSAGKVYYMNTECVRQGIRVIFSAQHSAYHCPHCLRKYPLIFGNSLSAGLWNQETRGVWQHTGVLALQFLQLQTWRRERATSYKKPRGPVGMWRQVLLGKARAVFRCRHFALWGCPEAGGPCAERVGTETLHIGLSWWTCVREVTRATEIESEVGFCIDFRLF